MEPIRIGIDLAKNFFHLVATDNHGKMLWRRALKRPRTMELLAHLKPAQVGLRRAPPCITGHARSKSWGMK